MVSPADHRYDVYTSLQLSGKLNSYLADIDQQAEAMFSRLVEQMAQAQGIAEALKAADPMVWVRGMNNIRASAEETINAELIYV